MVIDGSGLFCRAVKWFHWKESKQHGSLNGFFIICLILHRLELKRINEQKISSISWIEKCLHLPANSTHQICILVSWDVICISEDGSKLVWVVILLNTRPVKQAAFTLNRLELNVQFSICVKSVRLTGRLLLLYEYNSWTVVGLHIRHWMTLNVQESLNCSHYMTFIACNVLSCQWSGVHMAQSSWDKAHVLHRLSPWGMAGKEHLIPKSHCLTRMIVKTVYQLVLLEYLSLSNLLCWLIS